MQMKDEGHKKEDRCIVELIQSFSFTLETLDKSTHTYSSHCDQHPYTQENGNTNVFHIPFHHNSDLLAFMYNRST